MNIAVTNLQNKISIPQTKITTTVNQVCGFLRLTQSKKEISIIFVGPQRMKNVNKKFLGHDYVTDVITFDLGETAEIIICPVVALKNSKNYKQSITKEILLYVIHGLLHVAGYDDHTQPDIKRMRSKERQLLEQLA